MSNTDNAIQRWVAVKSAIQSERKRIMGEYARARARVLSKCGQDISLTARSLLVHDKPAVAVCYDGDVKACVHDGIMTSLISLDPSEHWPGRLGLWEDILSSLRKIDTEKIISAWAKATE
jgi:hypothetical protein